MSTPAVRHAAFPAPLTAVDPAGTAGDAHGTVWRRAPDGEWRPAQRHRGPVLAVCGDASAGFDGRVCLGSEGVAVHGGPATALAFVEGRPWSAGGDGRVWAGHHFVEAHDGAVTALVPRGATAWTAGVDGRIVEVGSSGSVERARLGSAIDALAAHGDELAAGLADGTLCVVGRTGTHTERLATVPVFFVARGADGWVAATTDGRVHAGGRSFATGAGGVFPIALDPDGRRVWVAAGGAARAWDLATGAPAGVLAPPDAIGLRARGLAVDASGVFGWDLALVEWPRPDPSPTADHAARVRGLLRAGDAVVSWSNDGCVVLREADLALRSVIAAHAGIVWSVAPSPDGTRLATGSEREVAVWSLDTGRCLGRWATPGHAVAWRAGTLLAGGDTVRLAVLGPEAAVTVRDHAGPGFTEQTQRILVEPDGAIVTGSTVGTAGWRFPADGGPPVEATLPPAPPPNAPAVLEGPGGVVRGSRFGEVGVEPPDRTVAARPVPPAEGAPPPWPTELGPDFVCAFLATAKAGHHSRAALHAALLGEGLPAPAAVLAWEAGLGAWRVDGVTIGSAAREPGPGPSVATLPSGERVLRVATDWPSSFHGDGEGVAWELRLGRWSQVGPLRALLPLLALRHAAGSPFAAVDAGPGHGEVLARALRADPVALGTADRWWLGSGARVEESAGHTRVVVTDTAKLVTAVRAVGEHAATVVATSPKVTEAPFAEAPAGGSELALDAGRKPGLVQRVAVAGRLVEELVLRGTTAKSTRWVRVSGAEPPAVSESARTWLAEQHARRDPRDTADAPALAERLLARGYTVHDAALEAEALVGGLQFPDPQLPDEPWIAVGAFQYLTLWPQGWALGAEVRAAGAIPLAYGPGDGVWVVFPDGSVGWQEMVAMAAPVVVADGVLPWLERLIRACATPQPLAELPGRQGAALAAALGCAPVPAATDGVGAWWTGDGIDLSEGVDLQAAVDGAPEPGIVTSVRAARRAAKRVGAVLRAAARGA